MAHRHSEKVRKKKKERKKERGRGKENRTYGQSGKRLTRLTKQDGKKDINTESCKTERESDRRRERARERERERGREGN